MTMRSMVRSLLALTVFAVVLAAPATPPPTSAQEKPGTDVTYSKHIAPLFQQHCQECHRTGDVAPFSLESYATTYRERRKILRAVETRKMPPWKPVPGFGDIIGSRRLSDDDIQ